MATEKKSKWRVRARLDGWNEGEGEGERGEDGEKEGR